MGKYSKKEILKRINYIQGHLEGVKKMIDSDRYCIDIINQSKGITSALKKVNKMILANHLNCCIVSAIERKDEKDQKEKIEELLEILIED